MEESQTGGLQSLVLQCCAMNNSHTNAAFSEIPLSVCSGFEMPTQLLICSCLLGVFNLPEVEVLSQGTEPRKPCLSVAFFIARKGLTSLRLLYCGDGVCSQGLGVAQVIAPFLMRSHFQLICGGLHLLPNRTNCIHRFLTLTL